MSATVAGQIWPLFGKLDEVADFLASDGGSSFGADPCCRAIAAAPVGASPSLRATARPITLRSLVTTGPSDVEHGLPSQSASMVLISSSLSDPDHICFKADSARLTLMLISRARVALDLVLDFSPAVFSGTTKAADSSRLGFEVLRRGIEDDLGGVGTAHARGI